MLLFLQVPQSCLKQSDTGETQNVCQEVYLTADQLAALGTQINGAAFFLAGVGCMAILCLASLVLIHAIGGR